MMSQAESEHVSCPDLHYQEGDGSITPKKWPQKGRISILDGNMSCGCLETVKHLLLKHEDQSLHLQNTRIHIGAGGYCDPPVIPASESGDRASPEEAGW